MAKSRHLTKKARCQGVEAGSNRNFVVAMGTSIPRVLETAIPSDQPGFN